MRSRWKSLQSIQVKLIARIAFSTDSVTLRTFSVSPGRQAGKVLTGAVDIDLMMVPKLPNNVPKNVPITFRRKRYTSLKKYLHPAGRASADRASRYRFNDGSKITKKCTRKIPITRPEGHVTGAQKLYLTNVQNI